MVGFTLIKESKQIEENVSTVDINIVALGSAVSRQPKLSNFNSANNTPTN
jgi:hypothetical protein